MYTDILIYLIPFEAGSEMVLPFLFSNYQCLSIESRESFLKYQDVQCTSCIET